MSENMRLFHQMLTVSLVLAFGKFALVDSVFLLNKELQNNGFQQGLPEAEAREVPQGTPKEQLVAFAKNLGVKTSSGVSGRHLKTELIIENIHKKMGADFEIPTFLGKKPGPQRTVQNATEL